MTDRTITNIICVTQAMIPSVIYIVQVIITTKPYNITNIKKNSSYTSRYQFQNTLVW